MFFFRISLFAVISTTLSVLVYANDGQAVESGSTSAADADVMELESLLVTGTSPDGTALTLPNSVLVISAAEITSSGADSLVDVLRGRANLNLQSFSGTADNASIDIRGMGATAVSNVLLMVDGQRLNNDDLSGADFASVPLEAIERIEIIRGGGSVRYGNGAVGGVINVITKSLHSEGLQGSLLAQGGSYNTQDLRSDLSFSTKPVHLNLTLSDYVSDGFRDNGEFERRAAAGKIKLELSKNIEFHAGAAYSIDQAGLPGPVSRAELFGTTSTRRSTDAPFDFSDTDELRSIAGLRVNTEQHGNLVVEASYRDRDNPFILGFTPARSVADQLGKIDTTTLLITGRYELPFSAVGYRHNLYAGLEWQDTDYLRSQDGANNIGSSTRRLGEVGRSGTYVELVLNGPSSIAFTGGYRLERFSTSQADQRLQRNCDTVLVPTVVPPGIVILVPTEVNCRTGFQETASRDDTWYNHATSLGLTWQPQDWLTFFASINSNFRSPNVDELLFATDDLGPQKGFSKDVGIRVQGKNNLDVSLSLFSLRIEDEIVFAEDPILAASVNRNLDSNTERNGLELEISLEPVSGLRLSGNLGYVRPRLQDSGTDIPLVPRVTAALAAEVTVMNNMFIGLDANHVSKRIDGNDFGTSQFPILKPYTVLNLNWRYSFGSLNIVAGIRNLTDEIYSTIAYSGTYYPMPERNGYLGISYVF